jgi:hypothetical protein
MAQSGWSGMLQIGIKARGFRIEPRWVVYE